MELRHLRYFVGVAHHLNYSEASRRLHVAQPAISQTILDLEAGAWRQAPPPDEANRSTYHSGNRLPC
jgi:Transcriptional regulator